MKLTLYTDYSLRVLLYLASHQSSLSNIQEISDYYHISKNHLMKVTYNLGKLGYIDTIRGRNGGIKLSKEPEEINIGVLVRQTEEDFYIVECFGNSESCILSPACTLKQALSKATKAFLAVLDEYTLADLIKSEQLLFILNNQKSENKGIK